MANFCFDFVLRMLKKAAKEQQEAADVTTTLMNNTTVTGDMTINMASVGLNRRSIFNELENKIGEIEKIKESEEQQASNEDDGLSNDANEPAEKGN